MYHSAGVPALFLRFRNITYSLALVLGMIPLKGIAQICNISVPATMVDATTGKFIPTIQPAMLHARINKDFLPVSEVERIRNFRVLLLVDGSGSMSVEGGAVLNKKETVQHIKEILDENLDHLPDGVQVAFGIFNKQVVFGNEFTSDPDRLHHIIPETIARLKSAGRGSTALLDAIHQGLAQFTPVRPGDTIVLLTDGEDNVSTHISEKELARELSRKGVRLFVLWVKDQSPAAFPWAAATATALSEFAERSGGTVYTYGVRNSAMLHDSKRTQLDQNDLNRFWNEEILSAYQIRFSLPSGTKNDQKWLLAVDPVANGGNKMAADYPSRLEPCPVSTAVR
jgi:Mg-chelatase subunit ChlD